MVVDVLWRKVHREDAADVDSSHHVATFNSSTQESSLDFESEFSEEF